MDGKSGQNDRSFETEIKVITSRLRSRRKEIEQAVVRACPQHGADRIAEAQRNAGLQHAVTGITDYVIERIESEESALPPVPSAAVSQVQRAAREEIELDTVVVGLITGYALLNEFILRDADELTNASLHRIQARQVAALQQLISVLAQEHKERSRTQDGLITRAAGHSQ